MSQIEPIDNLPDLKWKEYFQRELVNADEMLRASDFVWRIGDVAAVGFIYSNLLSAPWMWFLLAEDITIGDLIDFRRLSSRIPVGTLTSVMVGYDLAFRFAKFYGFEELDETHRYLDSDYRVMRKV